MTSKQLDYVFKYRFNINPTNATWSERAKDDRIDCCFNGYSNELTYTDSCARNEERIRKGQNYLITYNGIVVNDARRRGSDHSVRVWCPDCSTYVNSDFEYQIGLGNWGKCCCIAELCALTGIGILFLPFSFISLCMNCIGKCHRDPSFDRLSVKQINNRRSIKNHSTVTDQKLTRSITIAETLENANQVTEWLKENTTWSYKRPYETEAGTK
ncbi:hypothetical protein BpHYR1_013226, partial [Brachionus plicatilis]